MPDSLNSAVKASIMGQREMVTADCMCYVTGIPLTEQPSACGESWLPWWISRFRKLWRVRSWLYFCREWFGFFRSRQRCFVTGVDTILSPMCRDITAHKSLSVLPFDTNWCYVRTGQRMMAATPIQLRSWTSWVSKNRARLTALISTIQQANQNRRWLQDESSETTCNADWNNEISQEPCNIYCNDVIGETA